MSRELIKIIENRQLKLDPNAAQEEAPEAIVEAKTMEVEAAEGDAEAGELEDAEMVEEVDAGPAPAGQKLVRPEVAPGDQVKVHVRIVEGQRERVQVFNGTVIRTKNGGNNASFTVRRIASHGVGVERTFLLHSPRVEKVEVVRHSMVRRAKLYYLRDLTGKKSRLKERR